MTADAFTRLAPSLLPANVPWSHSTENALQAQAQADALQRQIRADVRLAHAAYLHARSTAGWRDKKAAWINVAGFAAMVFNLFFINLVTVGLHSYAGVS